MQFKFKNGIMINVNVSVKSTIRAIKILVGVPAHLFLSIVSI